MSSGCGRGVGGKGEGFKICSALALASKARVPVAGSYL